MAENDNTFLTANNLYEEVEGEAGKTLSLEDDQRINLVGIIKDRFQIAEDARNTDEKRLLKSYDELLNDKYKVTLNKKTIERVKNYFQ